jgi:hypothetical protein
MAAREGTYRHRDGAPSRPQPLSEDDVRDIVRGLQEDAQNHVKKNVHPVERRNWRRYHGEVVTRPVEGGSEMVARAVRDTVSALMPELLELLAGQDQVVEFIAPNSQFAELCQQATAAVTHRFWTGGGWQALNDALMDAAVGGRGGGWLKVYKHVERKRNRMGQMPIPEQMLPAIEANPQIQLRPVPGEPRDEAGNPIHDVATYEMAERHCISAVPSGDMYWTADDGADNCWLIGQRTDARLGDLARLGVPPEKLMNIGLDDTTSDSRASSRARDNADTPMPRGHGHWTLTPINYYENYVQLDIDGDGLPERYMVILAGRSLELLAYWEVDDQPFVQVPLVRVPHGMYAEGMADRTLESQESETFVLRGLLDNSRQISEPMILAPNGVDHHALAHWRRHGVIRNNSGPGAVTFFSPPDATANLLGVRQALEMQREEAVGISRTSRVLDPNALASVPTVGVEASYTAAQRKLQFYARTVAEFGLKPTFSKLLRLLVRDEPFELDIPGQGPQQIDPGQFDPEWDVRVKVGLGNASQDEHNIVYQQMMALAREMIVAEGAISKGTSPSKVLAMIRDWLRRYPSVPFERYFTTPEEMKSLEGQEQGEEKPDPKMVEAQGKLRLGAQKLQIDQQKTVAELGLKQQEQQHEQQMDEIRTGAEMQLEAMELAMKERDADARRRIQAARPPPGPSSTGNQNLRKEPRRG